MAVCNQLHKFIAPRNGSLLIRFSSTLSKRLIFSDFGDPVNVIRLEEHSIDEPKNNEVLIKMLAAPVNPADINTIQGVYPVKPQLPAIPGNEGVGEVVQVGEKVKGLKAGDWVVPRLNAWGTWRTHALCPEEELQKIVSGLNVASAATMSVNPSTAYRMLKDFVELEPGDVVIQNGSNSACGQCVIQLCREWGYTTVNVIRNRPNLEEVKEKLIGLGANYVVTEEELPSLSIFKKDVARPKLGLNCVGGKSCLNMLRHLDAQGVIVTYGGMSREPVTVPTSALIFKDIAIRGYWMTRWNKENSGSSDHIVMLAEISSLLKTGKLLPPAHAMHPIADFQSVLSEAVNITGKTGVKSIFDFSLNC